MRWWMLIWVKNTTPLCKILYARATTTGVCVCLWVCADVCVPSQGDLVHPDGSRGECGAQQRRCYGIMEDVSLVSLITGLHRCLSLSHKHTPLTGVFPLTQTHTHTPVSFPFPPSLRGFTHHLIGLNQLWQCWPRSHTPCLGGTPHYETITPLIDS